MNHPLSIHRLSFLSVAFVAAALAFASSTGFLAANAEKSARRRTIVNGIVSDPSSRRFYAKSGYDNYDFTKETLCGATLIHSDIAITAAHCQGAFNNGMLILDETTNDFTRLVHIDRQVRHPGWNIDMQKLNFDVLVMRLAAPLASTDVARPIPINSNSYYPSNGQRLMAYGFGVTENEVVSPDLKEAHVTYINNDECWSRGIQFNNVRRGEEVMCTDPFGGSTATCLGDSGGPLTDETGSTLIGIISFGSGCEADRIPDGHVRLSEVADWVQESICLLSKDPPAGCYVDSTSRDPRAVQMAIDFRHDFYPEETTFVVRSKETLETVYAGPQYVPKRNGSYRATLFLLPGEYTFEVYDVGGNGLSGSGKGEDGSWTVLALYDGFTETDLASGGHTFGDQQVTRFVVDDRNTVVSDLVISNQVVGASNVVGECMAEKELEESIGAMYNTKCDCEKGIITCTDANNNQCKANHQTCYASSDCCSGRKCKTGKCRAAAADVGRGRNEIRIGSANRGASRGASRSRSGNLRTR